MINLLKKSDFYCDPLKPKINLSTSLGVVKKEEKFEGKIKKIFNFD